MTNETTRQAKPNGPAAAAMISAMIGLVVMGLVHIGTDASDSFKKWVHSIGKLWIPGAQGIGPYSGKETFLLIAWLGSWLILYAALRRREVNLSASAAITLLGIGLATLLVWTPFIHLILPG